MAIPVEGTDPAESQPTVGDSGAADFAEDWARRGASVTAIGHRTVNFNISGTGPFPDSIKGSIFKIAQACTTTGAGLTAAAVAARAQATNDTDFQTDYKDATEALTKSLTTQSQMLTAATMGGSPAFLISAQADTAAARAARQQVLDGGVTKTQGTLDCLPEHGRQAVAAQEAAYNGLTLRTGYETPAQTTAPAQIAPRVQTANNNGANPKPSTSTPSKPSGEKSAGKPTDNKNEVAGDNAGKPTTPQQNQQQGGQQPQQSPQGQQQGAPQGGAPTGGAPTGGAPAGGQQNKGIGGVAPVPAVQPIRTDNGSRGGGVRPSTPPAPPSSNSPIAGKGGVLGSGANGGSTAAPAGNGNQTNKAGGGIGSGAGGGSTANSGTGNRPMGGMMGGHGGAGAGGQGATVRPKGEVKSTDKRMSAEDIAEQALGGVIRDGDDGKPVLPPPPGNNGKAPTPPPIPPKP